jgi:hypothetical protein
MAEAPSSRRPRRGRTAEPGRETLSCSFCQTELGDDIELTISRSGKHGQRTESSFCSTYCRDCVLALAALHPSPLASSDFISKRALVTDRLLDLWRHGRGPDPVLVLQAARVAGSGLASADAVPASVADLRRLGPPRIGRPVT